jgi:hypothetical protein
MFKKIKSKIGYSANQQKRLTEEDLLPGDHIYVRRGGLVYSHHGIFAGERSVIHFKGEDKEKRDPFVVLSDIESFLNGGKLRRRIYKERLPHSETLRMARELLSTKGYNLASNNCEHFATFCATGKGKSKQVRRTIASFGIIGIALIGRLTEQKLKKDKNRT